VNNDCNNKFIDFIHILSLIITVLVILILISYFLIVVVILVVLYLLYTVLILKKTQELIKYNSEFNSHGFHHAIIIAHKINAVNGEYNKSDYLSGIDLLIEKFQKHPNKINYKIYEVDSKEQVIPIINDDRTTHLWIFGHGQRNKLRFQSGNLCYFEVRDAPKKQFIGQYHCNTLIGNSLADYNQPRNQDVSRWLRFEPFIRIAIFKKFKELESKNLLF